MSRIDIRHPHSLPKAQARKAVDDVARKLEERFQLDCGWEGDILNFSRSGIDGHIALSDDDLHVSAKLGFLAAMFKEPIEAEIRRVLKEKF
ncbi:polyhydroxyalkanoic acid system family protein [Thermomonas paludicola]|uniref:polyhydroxyalkanoic acid system family protein n=1 Tax=Thermomonas paludicola TaxID=2884874 RepID=UPI002114FE05|nr:polyhydroxyalkanoic acid system family protein [Thermomonas paludicola]